MGDELLFHIEDQIAVLQVNRPQSRNSLNWAAQERFAQIVGEVTTSKAVRALIITGVGDKAFVSGGDLRELAAHPEKSAGSRLNQIMSHALHQLTQLPIPVLAAINGDAIGGGFEMLLACDLRLAAPHVRFRFAQVSNGLTTGWGGTDRLIRQIGQSRALELLLSGRILNALEAEELGIIHRVPPANLAVLEAAQEWAWQLLALPRQALAQMKRLIWAAGILPPTQLNQLETELFVQLWGEPDHQNALQAFLNKGK